MGRDTGIASRLRARGLKVVEVDGWPTRGSDSFAPRGSVNHHTAGGANGNAPSLGVCINGRADLAGPLCNAFQARDNTIFVVAAGRANHAGQGTWRGLTGNSSVFGLEIENVGTNAEPWRPDQLETAALVHAAFLDGVDPTLRVEVCQHKEWATPPGRKVDAHDWNGTELRTRVGQLLGTAPPGPTPGPPADNFKERVMALPVLRKGSTGQYVRNMQGLLVANGQKVAVDGAFGPGTEAGLKSWQGRAGLGADGICGPNTWSCLVGV